MRILFFLILPALFFIQFINNSQDDWILKTDKDGIRVYSHKDSNSKFNQLKLECSIQSNLSTIVAVILDVPAYPQWVYNNKSARILKKTSDREMYFYEQIETPFGSSNRDFAGQISISQDLATKIVRVSVKSVPNYVPVDKNFVRVPLSDETWIITPMGSKNSMIQYELKIDPGGSVPAWLVNSFSEKGPYESFHKLRHQVTIEKYIKTNFALIDNFSN